MSSSRAIYLALVLIVLATFAAYANSLSGGFVFDDQGSIVENTSLTDWQTALLHSPADRGQTVGGRPLLNLTFAVNYAFTRLAPRGYHVVNYVIHLANALLLFGLVRRTLIAQPAHAIPEATALFLATAIALLWALHPLQTAAVTYIVQRAESLCALFYLLTLYAFLRGAVASAPHAQSWYCVAVAACALGMACKEVMATAPLVVVLFDRAFVSGTLSDTLKKHGKIHATLASTWIILIFLVAHNPARAGSVGFNSSITWQDYSLTQISAIVQYLRLAFWPTPLIFDYGTFVVHAFSTVWLQALILAVLAGASLWGLIKNRSWGFLGCVFFLVLAPSSSVIPIATQTIAEHRVYLPLAAVSAFSVLGLHRLLATNAFILIGLVAIAAGFFTSVRNRDYRSPLALWQDTVEKRPENSRAQLNAGVQLALANQNDLALPRFREAVRLAPVDSDARNNFANALKTAGKWDEAIEQYGEAVRLGPRNGKARLNFGRALAARARWKEASEQFGESAKVEPGAEPQVELGRAHVALGQLTEAENDFRAALALEPSAAPALTGLGEVLARTQRLADAEATLRHALEIDPHSAAAHNHLGNVYMITHRPAEALAEFQTALEIVPDSGITYFNTGIALITLHRRDEAEKAFEQAALLDPGNQRVKEILARLKAAPR